MNEPARTTCPYCGVGCGLLARDGADGVEVQADPAHPANLGRICAKGANLGETVGHEGRLLHPQLRGRQVTWFRALDEIASGFRRLIETYGPESVALYVSGQLLTEDYYVANKLVKGGFGTANIDTNSRLCMSSAVAGHARAFGEDLVPGCYEDFEQARLVVIAGSNMAWCHPVLYQRLQAARAEHGTQVIVIDPRRTATAEEADLHLPLQPGTDGWLLAGLLAYLADHGHVDEGFVAEHTTGFAETVTAARAAAPDPAAAAAACGLEETAVRDFYRRFAATEQTVTLFSQGINQSSSGTDQVSAILHCHLATGRIGRPGTGPFSLTGQPNAMGGREVGGLANTLAAHRGFEAADDIQAFWGSPRIARGPGPKAVELFERVHEGRIRGLWILGTNPVVSLPDADRAREALRRCELVAVSDMTADTDTAVWADALLPAAAWAEKDGTVTNSERRISRQRAFRAPPGEARPDWWMLAEVGRRLGYPGFEYAHPAEIFDEHARLSGHANGGRYAFDISGLAGLGRAGYDALEPVQWPLPEGAFTGAKRLFVDGRFATPDGRARFHPVHPHPPAHAVDDHWPLRLVTGRVRDHWHTLTRSARAPRLCRHEDEPRLDLHPADAAARDLREGALARIESRWGQALARVRVSDRLRSGDAFLPIHWSGPFASQARVGAVVNPAVCPDSGEPELKHTPVRVAPLPVAWYGFAFLRTGVLQPDGVAWWVRVPGERFTRYELAGTGAAGDWGERARAWLGAGTDSDWLEYADRRAGHYRAARVVDDRLEACLFVAPAPELPDRSWLAGLFAREALGDRDRMALLAGRPAEPQADPGPTVCSCFGVGRNTLCRAIREEGLDSTDAVGAALHAGTNCGACLPEIRGLLP